MSVTVICYHRPDSSSIGGSRGEPSWGGYVYGLSVHLPLAYRVVVGGTQNQDIGQKELCALGDVRHHDSHQSCCLCP